MNLSPADLFILFDAACKKVGLAGYVGYYQNQSVSTQKAWVEFHNRLAGYWPKALPNPSPEAKKADQYTNDEHIRRIIATLDDAGLHRLYQVLHYMGQRINK